METMIGIGVLLAGIGVFWICFALGIYYFTRTGREGMRIQRMEEERRHTSCRKAVAAPSNNTGGSVKPTSSQRPVSSPQVTRSWREQDDPMWSCPEG